MAEKQKILGDVASKAGKSVSSLFSKAKETVVNAVDANGDGTFSMEDVHVLSDAIGAKTKEAIATAKENSAERKIAAERKALQPFFADDIDGADFALPKLLNVGTMDKKHQASKLCQGSIGCYTDTADMKLMTIYDTEIGRFGITLFPDADHEFYYVDPSDRDLYIALDNYFGYLKDARVNELQRVAQSLGAKHFKVTLKEAQSNSESVDAKAKAKVKAPVVKADADALHSMQNKEATTIEISAEMNWVGKAPQRPTLKYLKNEPNITNLIEMRMDPESPLTHLVISIKLANSSFLKQKDAAKIDAAIKGIKNSADLNLSSSVLTESRRFFEYEIDF